MDFSIIRSGKKITLTEDEVNGLFIKKDFYDFVEVLKEVSDNPEFIALYLYLSTNRDKIEKEVLEEVMSILGIKKTRQSLDDIDFSVLEEEDEEAE